MKYLRSDLIIAVIILVAATLLCGYLLWFAPQTAAQEPCQGVLRPAGPFVNVRSRPVAVGTPVATIAAGTFVPSHPATQSWYQLCDGRYVGGAVVFATNTAVPAPSSTPTRVGGTPVIPECHFVFGDGTEYVKRGFCGGYSVRQFIPTQWNQATKVP